MESILIHTHSGLRWIFLAMMIFVLFRNNNNIHSDPKKKIDLPLYTLILFAMQIVIGLILYFISHNVSFEAGFMKNSQHRFFTMEHELGMTIAFILMLFGYIKLRKTAVFSWNKILRIYYGIALFIIFASIPWPFRGFGNGWF